MTIFADAAEHWERLAAQGAIPMDWVDETRARFDPGPPPYNVTPRCWHSDRTIERSSGEMRCVACGASWPLPHAVLPHPHSVEWCDAFARRVADVVLAERLAAELAERFAWWTATRASSVRWLVHHNPIRSWYGYVEWSRLAETPLRDAMPFGTVDRLRINLLPITNLYNIAESCKALHARWKAYDELYRNGVARGKKLRPLNDETFQRRLDLAGNVFAPAAELCALGVIPLEIDDAVVLLADENSFARRETK